MGEYRISQLAERTGFSASTLRFYEQAGLLPDTARTPGGYRTYDDRAVDRLRFIARAKQLGLPLEEIRDLTAVWDSGSCAPVQDRLAAQLTGKLAEVRRRVAELTAFGDQLEAARDGLGRHTPDGCCDDTCGCLGPTGSVPPAPQIVPLMRARPNPPMQDPPEGAGEAVVLDVQAPPAAGHLVGDRFGPRP
jgi:MerR family transcriptional regulator, copper efflux regulator